MIDPKRCVVYDADERDEDIDRGEGGIRYKSSDRRRKSNAVVLDGLAITE